MLFGESVYPVLKFSSSFKSPSVCNRTMLWMPLYGFLCVIVEERRKSQCDVAGGKTV